jgi:hypothetical protein
MGDPGDLGAVSLGGDQERRQPPIRPDPATAVAVGAREVVMGGVQVGRLDVETDPPPSAAVGDGGEHGTETSASVLAASGFDDL